jgi:tyrosyl-tRNA synthetase
MIANVLKDAGLVNSTSDAIRMIKQGAVKIDGEKVDNTKHQFTLPLQTVLQIGKRKFARITFK